MKAVRITELDLEPSFPIAYILKKEGMDEMVGCCPKAFFNFFGLLGLIDGLKSEFLFWLKAELQESDETLITPPYGLKAFIKHPIFEKLETMAGHTKDLDFFEIIGSLNSGMVLLTVLFDKGLEKPSHCVVFYIQDKKLFADGAEISLETFAQMLFCHEKNIFIIGKKKEEGVNPRSHSPEPSSNT